VDKKRIYERVGRWYDLLDHYFEVGRYQAIRPLLFEGLSGQLLDAGVGTGRNMPFYPAGSTVTGIDLSPAMLKRAQMRREALGITVDLKEADIRDTGLAAESFDGIVSTFVFCVLDDDQQLPAMRELARLIKPGGEIRLLDYRLSQEVRRRFIMKYFWAPVSGWLYGAAFDRTPEKHAEAAGLEVVSERFVYRDVIRMMVLRRQ